MNKIKSLWRDTSILSYTTGEYDIIRYSVSYGSLDISIERWKPISYNHWALKCEALNIKFLMLGGCFDVEEAQEKAITAVKERILELSKSLEMIEKII